MENMENLNLENTAEELAVAKSKIKALQKQVKELKQELKEANLQSEHLKTGFERLQSGLQEMDRRRALDEERASYRQEMLFNGIKLIAEDVQYLKHLGNATQDINGKDNGDAGAQPPGSAKKRARLSEPNDSQTPASVKHTVSRPSVSENRKNFEHAMQCHIASMNDANTLDEVQAAGELAVKYSKELLKNFL